MLNTRVKKENGRIDAYVTYLKQEAASYEFENLKDSLIKNRIDCKIKRFGIRHSFF